MRLVGAAIMLAFTSLADAAPSGFQAVAPGTSELPGVELGTGTNLVLDATLAGTALWDVTLSFSQTPNLPPLFQGTLRYLIVQRTETLTLDLYYQISNTSHLAPVNTPALFGADIFRIFTGSLDGYGFTGDDLFISYRTDGLAGITGAAPYVVGTKSAYSADRELGGGGGVGFDFDPFQFINLNLGGPSTAPGNVESGETSNFLVIRTNATDPAPLIDTPAYLIGSGMATVPEPGVATLLVVGLGMALSRRVQRHCRRSLPVHPAKTRGFTGGYGTVVE